MPLRQSTPAGLFASATRAYAQRPALGLPLVDKRGLVQGDLSVSPFEESALVVAARMHLLKADDYGWVTYTQLRWLTEQVAKGLLTLGARGRFVAVAGYNTLEWSVADFATMLSGNALVGVHTTYSPSAAAAVLNNASPHVLLLPSLLLFSGPCSLEVH